MPLSDERARVAHLLRRAGFGATRAELEEYAALGFDAAVTQLINYESQPDAPDTVAPEEVGLQVWWLEKMLHTTRPLQEKMTLFWHGHLTSSLREVKNPALMLAQNQLLRRHALGNYAELLRDISRDAAMIEYLDLKTNRKAAPNENYARELMELFTLGIGNYAEDDVKEAARAFTGWFATPDGQFFFNRNQHDFGPKTVLGLSGNLDGDDVSNLLADHPTTARFMARKLFRFFAYSTPEPELVDRLAEVYLSGGQSIRALVEAILRSPEFSSEQAHRALIKSPSELLIGTLKALGAERVPAQLPNGMRLLGQQLFDPPNVAGWFGGRSWINASTLLARFTIAGQIVNQVGQVPPNGQPSIGGQPVAALLRGASTPEQKVRQVLDLLLGGDVMPDEQAALVDFAKGAAGQDQARGIFRLALALPAYQLN